ISQCIDFSDCLEVMLSEYFEPPFQTFRKLDRELYLCVRPADLILLLHSLFLSAGKLPPIRSKSIVQLRRLDHPRPPEVLRVSGAGALPRRASVVFGCFFAWRQI